MAIQGKEWSDSELEAAVEAYLWMLSQEREGNSYSKATVNRRLREGPLQKRSKASIEYRMQNISAALEELCLPRIEGYVPAKNIGSGVKDEIRRLLGQKKAVDLEDYTPSATPSILSERVSRLRSRALNGIPRGIRNPERIEVQSATYLRDPLVKAWILENARGVCEGCGEHAPFFIDGGLPFLEVHHVRPLANGGADQISNAVALCPNCHRRCHFSSDREEFSAALYKSIDRLAP